MLLGAEPIAYYEFLRYGYCVVSVGSTYNNSSISHTGEETAASTRRGLTPILFLLCGAKHTVRGGSSSTRYIVVPVVPTFQVAQLASPSRVSLTREKVGRYLSATMSILLAKKWERLQACCLLSLVESQNTTVSLSIYLMLHIQEQKHTETHQPQFVQS